MQVPHNSRVELPLEQQQMMENLQMIEQLSRLVDMDHQQTCQISNNQKTFECNMINLDTKIQNFELMLQENEEKYQKQIQSLLLQIKLLLDHTSFEELCHKNVENTETVEKLKKNLLLMEEKLQELQQNDNQDILKKQIEVLSQRLSVKDKQIGEIIGKNEGLSEDFKHGLIRLLDMQHQLMREGQRHEEDQKKNDETCRQVKMISQHLIAKDQQISEITAKNEVLSEDLKNVWSKFSEMQLQLQVQLQWLEEEQKKNFDCCQQVELLSQQLKTKECQWEQQLQEQRQRQEQQDDEHQKEVQVKQNELNRQYEQSCWEAEQANIELKKTMDQLNLRMQQLEEKKEQHQDEPCSQLRFERQRPNKPNTSQNTHYRCQPQRKKF
uniref:Uncharacterized protein n=2 Tax=Eptatretus burgeri TaxID=7764 RepID=A0A8C4QNY6_EPTBU